MEEFFLPTDKLKAVLQATNTTSFFAPVMPLWSSPVEVEGEKRVNIFTLSTKPQ
jgi:hypothetical protein